MPEAKWDAGMREADERACRKTGKHITYVAGPIEVTGRNGLVRKVRGVNTADGLIVRIDSTMDAERIADHEIFHALLDVWDGQTGRRAVLDGLLEALGASCDREQLGQMLAKYKEAMRGIYSEDGSMGTEPDGDVLEDVDYDVLEEMLADAYAGINGHATGIDRMQDTVRTWLRENHVEQDFFQDNGTEQPTGPPSGQKENTAENGGERYSLGEYSQHQRENWAPSRRIVIYENPEQLAKFIRDSVENKTMGQKMYFGTITADLAERIRMETGLEVENYNLSLGSYEIRKILKDHGKEETEASRGQRPVVEEDFEHIVDVVLNPTKIARSEDNYMGKPAIQFTGNHNGRMNVVAVVSDKRLDLFVQTAFVNVKKEDLATPTGEQAPINTPEANSGTVFSNESIRNRIKNVKQQIQAVLDRTSTNHAAQMERYTELKDSDPEFAQVFYDSMMGSPYREAFEQYLALTEELEQLEKTSSPSLAFQNDSTAGGFVERMSVDDPVAEEEGENPSVTSLPQDDTETARKEGGSREQARAELIEALRGLSPAQMMGDDVGRLIDQYTLREETKTGRERYKVDRRNLKKALAGTLGLNEEQTRRLGKLLEGYRETVRPKQKRKPRPEPGPEVTFRGRG